MSKSIYLIKGLFTVLVCTLLMFSCQGESSNQDGGSAANGTSSSTPANGKLIGLRKSQLLSQGNDPITLSTTEDVATVIILRPTETIGTKSSLSPKGQMHSDRLAKAFAQCGIDQIYCVGNAAMQTAMLTSRSNACNVGLVKDTGTDELAKTIVKNFMGKKVMVIANPAMASMVVNQFAGTNNYSLPTDRYDEVFVLQVRSLGDAEVYHFTY